MKSYIPHMIAAVAIFVCGLLTHMQCSSPDVVHVAGEVQRDTIREKADTVIVKQTRTVYKPQYVYAPDSTKLCIEQLQMCADAYEAQSYDLWKLANTELEASKTLPWGSVKAFFSMPRYVDNPDSPESAFDFEAVFQHQDSTQIEYRYVEKKWYHRIGIQAGVGYGAGPLGLGPSVNIQAGYELFNLSDIWR